MFQIYITLPARLINIDDLWLLLNLYENIFFPILLLLDKK